MKTSLALLPPQDLEDGKHYLRRLPFAQQAATLLQPVIFRAYDVCPAFVVVESHGRRLRLPREEILLPVLCGPAKK